MATLLSNAISLKIVWMLVRPVQDTEAYKLKLIDQKYNVLKSFNKMTQREKDALGPLERAIFRIRQLLQKVPGADSQIAKLALSYYLVKEAYVNNMDDSEIESLVLENVRHALDNTLFVEEYLEVVALLEDAPANSAGAGISRGAQGASSGTVAGYDSKLKPRKKFKSMFARSSNVLAV